MLQIQSPFKQFFDTDGSPLDNGNIYIGAVGANPETNPITVYYDDAGTLPVSQPIKTINGYMSRAGSPAIIYSNEENYSITIKDKNGQLVASQLNALSFSNLQNDLAANTGSSLVGWRRNSTGAVDRTVNSKLDDSLNSADFGMVGDGVTYNDTQFQNFFNAVLATGLKGVIKSGTYKFQNPVVMDYASKATTGFVLEGDGVQRTIFWSDITTTGGTAFSLICSSTPFGVYPKIVGIGFRSNHNGVTFAVGKSNLTDEQNLIRLEIWVVNSNDGDQVVALEANNCYACSFEFNSSIGNTAATGTVLKMRQVSFSKFFVSLGSTATLAGQLSGTAVACHITQGFSYGNTFISPDFEVVYTAVVIDSVSAGNNTFIGGTYALLGNAAVIATAGTNNRFIQPNLNSGITNAPFFLGGTNAIGVYKDSAQNWQIAAPSNGATVQMNPDSYFLKITAANLSTLTVALPTNPYDGQEAYISTFSSIAILTVTSANGIFDGAVTPMPPSSLVSFKYSAANNTWFSLARYNLSQLSKLSIQAPTSGSTLTMSAGQTALKLNIISTLASLTIQLPPSPWDGMPVKIQSRSAVTSLTLTGQTGQTVNDGVTSLSAGTGVEFTYDASNNAWFRSF